MGVKYIYIFTDIWPMNTVDAVELDVQRRHYHQAPLCHTHTHTFDFFSFIENHQGIPFEDDCEIELNE